MKEDENMDKEIEIEDDFGDYYDENEEEEEKVEKKEVKTKAAKKKKTKKKEKEATEDKEIDLDAGDDELDFDDSDSSFKISGTIKYLVILVLGGIITIGLLYFSGYLSGAAECPQCEECSGVADDCPECPEPDADCPKLTSERCRALFGEEIATG